MAGSYKHCVADDGQLLRNEDFAQMIENIGDAYEAVEQMYGMIWLLARGNPVTVWDAAARWRDGLDISPGTYGRLGDK